MGRPVTLCELADWLKRHDDVAVMGHINPDGDAAGSCIAVSEALKQLGKRAYAVLPGGMPRMYADIEGAELVYSDTDRAPFAPRTVLVLDASDPKRLGELDAALLSELPAAVLDHHATATGCGEVWYIDAAAAATGELAVDLIDALGAELTPVTATWLYIAISTDCGQFAYSNTRPQTMRAAARLLELGIDVAALNRRLYRTRSFARLRLMGEVLARTRLAADGRIAWSVLTQQLLRETGALPEDSESLSSELLTVETAECSFLLTEKEDGSIRASLRSKEWLDVGRDVAARFGGGGHARAAGCTPEGPLEVAAEQLLARIEAVLAAGEQK